MAHIGIIKVLEENNIPIDFIAGSSIGSMIGGCYAAGLSIKEIEKIASDTDWKKIFSIFFDPHLRHGLINGKKIEIFLENYIKGKKIEECRIPFVAIATDLKTGEIIVLDKGKITSAIRASISMPLIFKPVEMDGRILADGGLSSPVPAEIVRTMGANIVIAVNLDKHYCDEHWKPGWYDIANDSLNILRHHLSRLDSREADITIEMDLGNEFWYEFVNGKDKILAGEKAARDILPRLREIIDKKN